MSRPHISWSPGRCVQSAVQAGYPSLEDLLSRAYLLGLRHIELHQALLPSRAPEVLRQLHRRVRRHGLEVFALVCAPDFTHPEPQVREQHYHDMLAMLQVARLLGTEGLRVTAGQQYPEVPRADGIIWCTEALLRLAEEAQRAGVKLGLQNQQRDRLWHRDDFAREEEVFTEILERTQASSLGVSFDTSHALLTATDPLAMLEQVRARVWHVRASDRFPGQHGHTVVGEGAVDFDAIFRCLAEGGFAGTISVQDGGLEGDEGLRRSLRFVRQKVAQWWA